MRANRQCAQYQARRAQYQARRAAGLCVRCKNPALPRQARCALHAVCARDHERARKDGTLAAIVGVEPLPIGRALAELFEAYGARAAAPPPLWVLALRDRGQPYVFCDGRWVRAMARLGAWKEGMR